MTVYDTIVIGAGTAVLLLEGRDRIGGRTYTTEAFGGQFDLGGGYVHWTQAAVWTELERHGLARIEPPLESEVYYQLADGKLLKNASRRFPLPWDLTAADNSDINMQTMEARIEGMGLSKHDTDLIKGALSGPRHDYAKQGSTQPTASNFGSYAAELESAGSWCIPGGMTKLSEAIQSTSKAKLRQQAGRKNRRQRPTVVVAVPLNTMRLLAISPALPEPVQELRPRLQAMGARAQATSLLSPPSRRPASTRSTRYAPRSPGVDDTIILCMISQSDGIKHDDIPAVQAALRKFVPDLEVIDTAWHDWNADEFSHGGWMMHAPRHFLDGAVEIRKCHGCMSFAGADIAAMGPGTIEGAMSSGTKAAQQVERTLKGNTILSQPA
ncbi:hypothetical protein PWT90_00497 [Aphanocladium album]|nr:hypothetical protein PWT90_00497 [Aphanocladium album]